MNINQQQKVTIRNTYTPYRRVKNFNVKFDGAGGGRSGGFGSGGGGGFEEMFQGFGGGGFGGQPRGGGGGSSRSRSGGKPQSKASELFPKNDPSGIAPLGKAKFPDAKSKFIWVIIFWKMIYNLIRH